MAENQKRSSHILVCAKKRPSGFWGRIGRRTLETSNPSGLGCVWTDLIICETLAFRHFEPHSLSHFSKSRPGKLEIGTEQNRCGDLGCAISRPGTLGCSRGLPEASENLIIFVKLLILFFGIWFFSKSAGKPHFG